MKKNIVIKKLNQDDILEILTEKFLELGADLHDFSYTQAVLLGKVDKDLRFICAFGKEEDDKIYEIDLVEEDKNLNFNGDHETLSKHPEYQLNNILEKND